MFRVRDEDLDRWTHARERGVVRYLLTVGPALSLIGIAGACLLWLVEHASGRPWSSTDAVVKAIAIPVALGFAFAIAIWVRMQRAYRRTHEGDG